MPKFTPGPWRRRKGFSTIQKSNGLTIVFKSPAGAAPEAWDEIHAQIMADSRLVQCAPEMYELLYTVLEEEHCPPELSQVIQSLLNRINHE